jgi:hypothetical protein
LGLKKNEEPHVTVVDVEPNPTADQLEAVLPAADAAAPRLRAGTGAQRAGWLRAVGVALDAAAS